MINGKDKPDNYLKNLLQKADMESPSPNFTDNVMNQIQALHDPNVQHSAKTSTIKNYYFSKLR